MEREKGGEEGRRKEGKGGEKGRCKKEEGEGREGRGGGRGFCNSNTEIKNSTNQSFNDAMKLGETVNHHLPKN